MLYFFEPLSADPQAKCGQWLGQPTRLPDYVVVWSFRVPPNQWSGACGTTYPPNEYRSYDQREQSTSKTPVRGRPQSGKRISGFVDDHARRSPLNKHSGQLGIVFHSKYCPRGNCVTQVGDGPYVRTPRYKGAPLMRFVATNHKIVTNQ